MKITQTQGKEHLWQETVAHFQHNVTDRLGKGIDSGILHTVVALNLCGFCTTGSCEGHLHEGAPAPWVDIAVAVPQEEQRQAVLLLHEAESQPATEDADNLRQKAQRSFRELDHYYLAVLKQLQSRLADFYQDHQATPYDAQLTLRWYRSLRGTVDRLRLESNGAPLLDLEQDESKLITYQREIQAFAAFLKRRYLSQE